MFLDFSKNKVIELFSVASLIGLFLFTSLFLDDSYHLKDSGEMYFKKSKVTVGYYFNYKLPNLLQHPKQTLSQAASILLASLPDVVKNNSVFFASKSYQGEGAIARSVPVLAYHGAAEGGAVGAVPTSVFIDHMQALKNAGWKSVSLPEFYSFMKEGAPLPDKSFLLTFDDGRKDTYYAVDPVLQDAGFDAVMFVITGFSMPEEDIKESSYYLSENELSFMAKSGRWDLQSHGKEDHKWSPIDADGKQGHFLSNKLWLDYPGRLETEEEYRTRILGDLSYSKTALEKSFGKEVTAYAFPFSDFGEDTTNFPGAERMIAETVPLVYDMAFYQNWSGNGDYFNYPDPASFMMKRIEPASDWSGQELLEFLNSGRAKDLPYESSQFGVDWRPIWGATETGGTLTLSAASDTTGASVFLNGGNLWRNYKFTAYMDWKSGSHVSLFARFKDNNNYLACVFSDGLVSIQKHKAGASETLWGVPHKVDSFGGQQLAITVKDDSVGCSVGDEEVLSSPIYEYDSGKLSEGGIGFYTWDARRGVAKIEVNNVKVEPI
jgi:peptidoglycan/xylan/chitin deacetylase (PgdA/CDA1 family)